MNHKSIEKLQKEQGFWELQQLINSGVVWKMEGSMGRAAMRSLETGQCMLPRESFKDYYGNRIPSRHDLKAGTKGTYQNCIRYWENFYDDLV